MNIFKKASLEDVSAIRAKMAARMGKKDDDTSPPDGGSDFKKEDDKPVSPPDGGSDFKKSDDKPVSPPDGGSDFKKTDNDTDDVGNADLTEHNACDDGPSIITIIEIDDVPDDSDDDDTDEAGKDKAIDDSEQDTDAEAKDKETAQESLNASTEGLLDWFRRLLSSKVIEAEWAENDAESIKKDLSKLPVFVGPSTDENSDKTISAFTPKQVKSFITDIAKARSVIGTIVSQFTALSLEKKYDFSVALQFVTKQINGIESPFMAVFHASSADGRLGGIGEHNIKKPKPKSDRVADLGWTGDQADKLCNALRAETTAYFKDLENGYKKIVAHSEALDKLLDKKVKASKDEGDSLKEDLRAVASVIAALTTGYRLCDDLVKRTFEACGGTFVQLGKVYPIRTERK